MWSPLPINLKLAVQMPSYTTCHVTFLLSRDQHPSSSSTVYVFPSDDNPIQFYRLPTEHAADLDDPQAYGLVQDDTRVKLCPVVTHCQQGGYVSAFILNATDDIILVPQVTAILRVDKAVGSLYKPQWVRQCELVGDLLCYRATGKPLNIWAGRAPRSSRESSTPDRLLPVIPMCCRAHEIKRFHDAASVSRVAEAWDDFKLSVWWPTITEDIWDHVNKCHECTFVLVIKGSVIDGPHPKGDEPTHGPFRVIKKLPRNNYKLADRRARHLIDEYPIWRLRAYPSRK